MVHSTDKPSLKLNLKESPYSPPNYERAIKYLNRSKDRSHVPIKAKLNIIVFLIIVFLSLCVFVVSNF